MTDDTLGDSRLSRSLKRRHMTMIALGGVIGAGLFVGSGVVIQSAGPATSISFLLTGLLVVLVMRMLGELATALPQQDPSTSTRGSRWAIWLGS